MSVGPVALSGPMNSCSNQIKLTKTMPIFATSVDKVRYWVNNEKETKTDRHVFENNMMDARWNYFKFSHSIPAENKVEVPECTTCWVKFILKIWNMKAFLFLIEKSICLMFDKEITIAKFFFQQFCLCTKKCFSQVAWFWSRWKMCKRYSVTDMHNTSKRRNTIINCL